MTTKPEDIYRALVEATCFGARTIIESFTNAGVKIDEIVASGGLIKDPFFMQTLADITCVPLSVATTKQGGALGAAAHGAVAAGFYPSIKEPHWPWVARFRPPTCPTMTAPPATTSSSTSTVSCTTTSVAAKTRYAPSQGHSSPRG